MPILLLILFLLVPATMAGQVAVSRAAPTNSGVLFREFDLPGGKAEYCWATSVAGSPDSFPAQVRPGRSRWNAPDQPALLFKMPVLPSAKGGEMSAKMGLPKPKAVVVVHVDEIQSLKPGPMAGKKMG